MKKGLSANVMSGMDGEGGAISGSFPIAIIGMGMRFPGNVRDAESMWNNLVQGKTSIASIPESRWPVHELEHPVRSEPGRSVTFAAGVLDDVEEFDAAFFQISPREAAWMDPQQRLLLEMTHEAMEDAGIPPNDLAGSNCGVFIGISGMDYGQQALRDLASMTAHTMTGNTLSIAANRISYFYDLHGPSLAVDTACSSSLAAIHQACQALRTGEIPIALAGGVNVLMHPYSFIGFSQASMLSASGQCRPFDAQADGYVRGEGGAVILLKPLDQALKDGNRIHAVILASGVNADGNRKSGLTIPSSDAQIELMTSVLARSGLDARDVDFVEAHGTGTPAGDPVEANSIGFSYGKNREASLPISSSKANFGHLEPASGMAGLVKAILAMRHAQLPPMSLDYAPNPGIDFKSLNIHCAANGEALAREKQLACGVNSFGFGGLNAHIILQEAPVSKPGRTRETAGSLPLLAGAKSEEALRLLAAKYAEILKSGEKWEDVAGSALFRRALYDKRFALWPQDTEKCISALEEFASGGSPASIILETGLPESGGIAFIYSGNGSQWLGMGQQLLAESPLFAGIMAELDELMKPVVAFSIMDVLQDPTEKALADTTISQPLLFAIQVGLTMLLGKFGVKPDAVAGHSVGEVAAAWASGALDLGQAIQVIHARSLVQGKTRGQGRMAAAGISPAAAKALVSKLGLENCIEIAAFNSPRNSTLSGDEKALLTLGEELEKEGVFFRILDLDYAFHSKKMETVKNDLLEMLTGLNTGSDDEAVFVSTVTGEELNNRRLDAAYWWDNMRLPVNFSGAVKRLAELGIKIFVEIGPHAVLQRYMRENLNEFHEIFRILPGLQQKGAGIARVRQLAASAHLLGNGQKLKELFSKDGKWIELPKYPWSHKKYKFSATSEILPETKRIHPILGWRLSGVELLWENVLDPRKDFWLQDHQVDQTVVFPAAAYIELAMAASSSWLGSRTCGIENLEIFLPLVFESAQTIRCALNPADGTIRILSRPRLEQGQWTENARCRAIAVFRDEEAASENHVHGKEMPADELYELTAILGLNYGPEFRRVKSLRIGDKELEAVFTAGNDQAYIISPGIVDACFHALAALYADSNHAYLPIGAERIEKFEDGKPERGLIHLKKFSEDSLIADFEIYGSGDCLLGKGRNCRFRRIPGRTRAEAGVRCWQVALWLEPLFGKGLNANLPSTEELEKTIEGRKVQRDRIIWHEDILPRLEAATLAAIAEAWANTSHSAAGDDNALAAHILEQAGFLDSGGVLIVPEDLPQWQEIWREAYKLAPERLAALLPLARRLEELSEISLGSTSLADALEQSAIASWRSSLNPLFSGIDSIITAISEKVAENWRESRRLRILELGYFPGDSEKAATGILKPDKLEFTSISSSYSAKNDFFSPHSVHIQIDPETWLQSEEASAEYDVIIARHFLHSSSELAADLAKLEKMISPGGLLMLAECNPDWSTEIIESFQGDRRSRNAEVDAVSAFMIAEDWGKILERAGFEDIRIIREKESRGAAEGAFLLLAKKREATQKTLVQPSPARWNLVVDEDSGKMAAILESLLKDAGQEAEISDTPVCSSHGDLVYMRGWKCDLENAPNLLMEIKDLVAGSDKTKRIWVITCGGSIASELPPSYLPIPAQAAVTGFCRVAKNEFSDLEIINIDLDPALGSQEAAHRLHQELLFSHNSEEILLTENGRYAFRALPEAKTVRRNVSAAKLEVDQPGRMDSLDWKETAFNQPPPGVVEARVEAVGLNFRDVMFSMGLLPQEALENGFAGPTLGLEFAGVVTRVGANASDFKPGDRVAGFAPACFASHVQTPAFAISHIADGTSFEQAAAVPTIFITAWYALKHLAQLQPGEHALIHGAAGGVGLAAIQIAEMLGAVVHATAGTEEKRALLRALGVKHVYNSRSLDFADKILVATDGKGVDVALNSLAGEAMRRTIGVLKPFGRFLELGKRDFVENTTVGLRPFKENISYFSIDVDQLLTAKPELGSRLFQEVNAHFQSGAFSTPPVRVFPASQAADAFRLMQQARHIGKIVINVSGQPQVISKKEYGTLDFGGTWLITGGLGGFGLAVARHIAREGAKNIILASRRGPNAEEAPEIMEEFLKNGINIQILACDFTDKNAVDNLLDSISASMPPLNGIVHAAAVFEDHLLKDMTKEQMDRAFRAKALSAWNLHKALGNAHVSHFILFSSISVIIGNPGQANYVAANAALESIALLRNAMGLAGAAIAWGPIGDAGYLARHEQVRHSLGKRLGAQPLTVRQALAVFDEVAGGKGVIIAANVNWNRISNLAPTTSQRFEFVTDADGAKEDEEDVKRRLDAASLQERFEIIRRIVRKETARVLAMEPEQISMDRSLQSLGLDSLMAVELAMSIEATLGVRLSAMLLQDGPSADQLARRLMEKYMGGKGEESDDALLESLARVHAEDLNPEQIRELLATDRDAGA